MRVGKLIKEAFIAKSLICDIVCNRLPVKEAKQEVGMISLLRLKSQKGSSVLNILKGVESGNRKVSKKRVAVILA